MIAISETGISKHDILSTIFENYEFHSKIPKTISQQKQTKKELGYILKIVASILDAMIWILFLIYTLRTCGLMSTIHM